MRNRLIPIASIITPSTLSTELAPVLPPPVRAESVPNLDFRSLNFVDEMQLQDGSGFYDVYHYGYQGPSQDVLSTATAVMAGGTILPIDPPAANASWKLTLDGPSISCRAVDEVVHRQIRQSIYTFANQLELRDLRNADFFGYMAWYPQQGFVWDGENTTVGAPFLPQERNGTLAFDSGTFNDTMYLFAASDSMVNAYNRAFADETRWSGWYRDLVVDNRYEPYGLPPWMDGTILTCQLITSTYEISFTYTDGLQHVDVQTTPSALQQDIGIVTELLGPPSNGSTSDTEACVPLYIPDWVEQSLAFPPDSFNATHACTFDEQLLRMLSYQAVWDAFSRVLQGSVHTRSGPRIFANSSILGTALLQTSELTFLRQRGRSQKGGTLQSALARYDRPKIRGLSTQSGITVRRQSLADALEEMFRNVTVSLMASSALR